MPVIWTHDPLVTAYLFYVMQVQQKVEGTR